MMDFYLILISATIVGLIVGSFLNVVIVRLPILLETRWRQQCQEFLRLPIESSTLFNLCWPRSHCPHCRTLIKLWHNIPILSYLLLRGRCISCKQKISFQYFSVEFVSGLTTFFIIYHFGLTTQAIALTILTWALIVLFFIDLNQKILPDAITLFFLWAGLFLSLFSLFISPQQAILGAIVGYGLLWITGTAYKFIRKREGMGHGDYKMLAMLGAWFGTYMILNILLLAVLLGLISAVILLLIKKISAKNPIPFGPFIAVAGWISIFTGPFIIHWIVPNIQ